jgi:hypothetical protein
MVNVCARFADRRQWWILAAVLDCAACGKTPVDAILAKQDAIAPDSGMPPAGDICVDGAASAMAGQFRLRAAATGQCLAVGSTTTVGGNPAWATAMADDCAIAGEIWDLIADGTGITAGSYEVKSSTTDYALDIRMAATADGTPAILYTSTTNANQRFFFRKRRAGVFELAPGHVSAWASCLSSAPPVPAIARCSSSATDQEWQLVPTDCE